MEIRFPATDAPHYLAQLCFSRGGAVVNVEVLDHKGYQKALFSIPLDQFREAMAMIGAMKVVEVEKRVEVEVPKPMEF